ncbi:MAG TPA: DUF5723 family protein [candidate division Zixibacteria bacterium]|nr:DUF5723 family protein [candidate division Zixibacteria bacterium]
MKYSSKLKSRIAAQVAAILISSVTGSASELSSARSLALSGAMTALSTGVDAARYNPANLGLQSQAPLQLELASFGANISNNSFTLDDYNKYTGATLSSSDKSDILAKIPKEGLNLKADAEAAALSLSFGTFAFSVSGVGAADANLNKDIMDLLLNGNSFADSVIVTGSYSDGIAYAQAGFSYGHLLYEAGSRQLAIGGTIKYIRGIGVEEIVKLDGIAATLATGFQGTGSIAARTATGGSGYGVDLGAALKLNQNYTIGARLENVLGSINWNKDTEEHGIDFSFDTMTINNANDSVIVSNDYSIDIPSFSTRLPTVMTLGVANTSGKLRWGIDWEQGFKRTAESSTKPRLSIGLEWLQLGMMPLRAGFSTGGGRGESFSFGSGFNFNPFYLDLAAVTGTGVSVYSAKGLKVALSTGIRF